MPETAARDPLAAPLAALIFKAVVESKEDEDHPDFAYFIAERLRAAGVRMADEGLDVERLARALHKTYAPLRGLDECEHDGRYGGKHECEYDAEVIAREYAALAKDPSHAVPEEAPDDPDRMTEPPDPSIWEGQPAPPGRNPMPETAAGRALIDRAGRLRPTWPFGAEDRLSSDTIARKVEEIEREARALGRAEALAAVETFRYSRPLGNGPEQEMWRRNEETIDAMRAAIDNLEEPHA